MPETGGKVLFEGGTYATVVSLGNLRRETYLANQLRVCLTKVEIYWL